MCDSEIFLTKLQAYHFGENLELWALNMSWQTEHGAGRRVGSQVDQWTLVRLCLKHVWYKVEILGTDFQIFKIDISGIMKP